MVSQTRNKNLNLNVNRNPDQIANAVINLVSIILLSIMLSLYSTLASAANITVRTSANPIALDDSFHLIYEADSSVDDDPDFSPLQEHFDILNSSQSTNMRLINGDYSLKKTWDLALIAKDVGDFTVPSISFGRDKSPAIRISIKHSTTPNSTLPNGQASIPAKIFLESTVDKKQSWVQEQIIYTVRLLRTVSITGASLSEPTTSDPDAIIMRLGEDNSYQTTRRGIRYEVIERRYVIYPQHSGKLTINPVKFEGRINATQPRTIFDQFRMSGQLKRLRSPAITTTVKPKPDTINTQDWLPASELTLIDDWSDDISKAKTGEPITRTITIVTKGLTGLQLPDLQFDEIANLKQYPDKPVTTDAQKNDGIIGAKQIKIALIPAAPGEYLLPEIKLSWWNTRTNRAEVATIAETRLTVTGNVAPPVQTVITPPATTTAGTDLDSASHQPDNLNVSAATEKNHFWKWLSMVLGSGWLLTLLYMLASRKKTQPVSRPKQPDTPVAVLEKAVIQACKSYTKNNTQAEKERLKEIKNALLAWAQARWQEKHITSLTQLAATCPHELKQEIQWLNQALYDPASDSNNNNEEHVTALSSAFKSCKNTKMERVDEADSVIEPLYKA